MFEVIKTSANQAQYEYQQTVKALESKPNLSVLEKFADTDAALRTLRLKIMPLRISLLRGKESIRRFHQEQAFGVAMTGGTDPIQVRIHAVIRTLDEPQTTSIFRQAAARQEDSMYRATALGAYIRGYRSVVGEFLQLHPEARSAISKLDDYENALTTGQIDREFEELLSIPENPTAYGS